MNNGVLIGYTRKYSNIQPGDTYPQLNVKYDDRTAFTLTQDDVNFVICTTSGSAVTITLPRMSLRSGECLHLISGAALVACAQAGLKVSAYPPAQVKLAVTGRGRAGSVWPRSVFTGFLWAWIRMNASLRRRTSNSRQVRESYLSGDW